MGGTLGVCVGASILTLVEFIEFLIMLLYRKLTLHLFLKKKTRIADVFA